MAHLSTYDQVKCSVCGEPWDGHSEACSRHPYRPTIRLDADGRDVTDLPGLWSEEDRFFYPSEVADQEASLP